MPSDRKWEEMVARHFVDQASLVLEATLSGNVQKIGEPSGSVPTVHTTIVPLLQLSPLKL